LKGFGGEFLSVALVLSIPLGVFVIFPFRAFEFRAAEPVRSPVRAAFVEMTPETERRVLRAARASWREKVGKSRHLRADLFCTELPEDVFRSVLSLCDRTPPPMPPRTGCGWTPFLPSLKAPPPSPVAAGAVEGDGQAFPRKELLKMN